MKRSIKTAIALLLAVLMTGLAGCGQAGQTDAQALQFKAGKYEGEGEGIHGKIRVSVSVDSDSIQSIDILEQNETEGIGTTAIDTLTTAVIDSQSLAVEAVSGATVTSDGFLEAVKNALSQSGVDMDALTKKLDADGKIEDVSASADVVIIGGGGSGLAAAVSAVQAGASVIVIEKMDTLGGSTLLCGAQFNAVDPELQSKYTLREGLIDRALLVTQDEPQNELHQQLMDTVKQQIADYKASGKTTVFDSPELHALQTYRAGDKLADLSLVLTLTSGAPDALQWLKSLGAEVQDNVATVTGGEWQRTHQFVKPLGNGPIGAYTEFLNAHTDKVQIFTGVKADEIIMENGRAVGVKASGDGVALTAAANKGVVLTTGGFARNSELIAKYDTHWGHLEGVGSTNAMGATGDGILMAQAVGANLVGMEWIQLLPVGNPETGGMQGNISINAANQLFINNNGERFVAEDARRDVLTAGILAQPDQEMWILQDAHDYTDPSVKNDFNEAIGDLVEQGIAVTGNTVEELAAAMNVDAAKLQATIDTYNKAVKGEIEDPFGKVQFLDCFDKPPYYAAIRVPTIHHTMGGVQINTSAQVIGTDGNVIPGLFAAGEVTGGVHGANRMGANAVPETAVFGRIAGTNAAKGE